MALDHENFHMLMLIPEEDRRSLWRHFYQMITEVARQLHAGTDVKTDRDCAFKSFLDHVTVLLEADPQIEVRGGFKGAPQFGAVVVSTLVLAVTRQLTEIRPSTQIEDFVDRAEQEIRKYPHDEGLWPLGTKVQEVLDSSDTPLLHGPYGEIVGAIPLKDPNLGFGYFVLWNGQERPMFACQIRMRQTSGDKP
mgnify:FL=1